MLKFNSYFPPKPNWNWVGNPPTPNLAPHHLLITKLGVIFDYSLPHV